MRVVYLTFYLRNETSAGGDFDLYRRAEAALNACVTRAEQGERCLLLDHELATVERLPVVHDEQLAAIPWHRTWTPGNGCNTTLWLASARRLRLHRSKLTPSARTTSAGGISTAC